MDRTDKLISISVIESILTDENTYLDFINEVGEFSDIDIEEYLAAINNYMSYIVERTSEVDEDLFLRINNINKKYGVDVKYEYLLYMLNTTRIVNIGIIEAILNDEETFNKFMQFDEYKDYFGSNIIDYLSSIWEYVSYMKERNLTLSKESLDKYNAIVREFSLDFKRASVLSGEYIEDKMDEKFANDILKNVDLNDSKFNIALNVYKELCKRCTYDPLFYALEQDMTNPLSVDIYNKSVSKINKRDNKVVCKTWAIMYQTLLNMCGFNARVDGGFHKYVVFDCDGTLIKADGTNTIKGRKDDFFLNDLTRCQLGMPVAGFECLENDKNIQKYLEENNEINIEPQNNLTDLSSEYRSKYMKNNDMSFTQAIELLNEKATKSKLKNTELAKYIDTLYRIMLMPFDNIQKDNHYVVIPKWHNKIGVSYLISYVTGDGDYKYYLFHEGKGFKNITQMELMKMINSKKIILPGKKKEILGIKEENNNGYVK